MLIKLYILWYWIAGINIACKQRRSIWKNRERCRTIVILYINTIHHIDNMKYYEYMTFSSGEIHTIERLYEIRINSSSSEIIASLQQLVSKFIYFFCIILMIWIIISYYLRILLNFIILAAFSWFDINIKYIY